jgi:hypothetical protein
MAATTDGEVSRQDLRRIVPRCSGCGGPYPCQDSSRHAGAVLARVGYEAYGESTGWLTHDGRPMPGWCQLGDRVQGAWGAAAGAIVAASARWLSVPGGEPREDELL